MVLEIDLFPPVEHYYQTGGYRVKREVPMKNKVIDIVCQDDEEIIAIEVKVRNWKKALKQAIIYQLCANKTYVALYHKYSRCIKKQLFLRYGVGLIEIDGSIIIKIESQKNVALNPFYINIINEYFKKKEEIE